MSIGQALLRVVAVKMCALMLALASFHFSHPAAASLPLLSPEDRCTALKQQDFSGIEDGSATVRSVTSESFRSSCVVDMSVSAEFDYELHLPTRWNGKLLVIPNTRAAECDSYVDSGYACLPMYRALKKGRSDAELSRLLLDRPERIIEWGYIPHTILVSAKAVVQHYFGKSAARAYFMGCSAGGWTGLSTAQRFPDDYDGMIVVAANTDLSDWILRSQWTVDHAAKLTRPDLDLLHLSALKVCDRDDGVADGLIGNPLQCSPRPERLLCSKRGEKTCLSAAAVDAAQRLYSGPTDRHGRNLMARASLLPGSELDWPVAASEKWSRFMSPWFGVAFTGARPMLSPGNVLFDRDYRRLGFGAALAPPNNPDLRRFHAAGGKMIAVQGMLDTANVVGQMTDYYEMTVRAMGGRRNTDAFLRYFMVPGMKHCTGGPGAYTIDYLRYLEAWVEQGRAPEMMLGAHTSEADEAVRAGFSFSRTPSGPVRFTRPVYPFPAFARYRGKGDVNDARNFTAAYPRIVAPTPGE